MERWPGLPVYFRFALTYPVRLAVVGCETPDEVATLLRAAAAGPLEEGDARALVEAFEHVCRERDEAEEANR